MMFQPFDEIDWGDQLVHVLIGMAISLGLVVYLPWWAAFLVTMAIAVAREQIQHPGDCEEGCFTDLAFWTCGSAAGVAIGVSLS